MLRFMHNGKRVSNRQRRRLQLAAEEQSTKVQLILIAVLAQKGGEVIVTQGTIDNCLAAKTDLNWEVKPSPTTPGEFVVRLLDGVAL